jgi:hypothetical protein
MSSLTQIHIFILKQDFHSSDLISHFLRNEIQDIQVNDIPHYRYLKVLII